MGLFFYSSKNIKKHARSKILNDSSDDWNATRIRLAVHRNFDYSKVYLFNGQKNGIFFPVDARKSKENNWF